MTSPSKDPRPLLDVLRELDAEVLLVVYSIDVHNPTDAPLDQAIAAAWHRSRGAYGLRDEAGTVQAQPIEQLLHDLGAMRVEYGYPGDGPAPEGWVQLVRSDGDWEVATWSRVGWTLGWDGLVSADSEVGWLRIFVGSTRCPE